MDPNADTYTLNQRIEEGEGNGKEEIIDQKMDWDEEEGKEGKERGEEGKKRGLGGMREMGRRI